MGRVSFLGCCYGGGLWQARRAVQPHNLNEAQPQNIAQPQPQAEQQVEAQPEPPQQFLMGLLNDSEWGDWQPPVHHQEEAVLQEIEARLDAIGTPAPQAAQHQPKFKAPPPHAGTLPYWGDADEQLANGLQLEELQPLYQVEQDVFVDPRHDVPFAKKEPPPLGPRPPRPPPGPPPKVAGPPGGPAQNLWPIMGPPMHLIVAQPPLRGPPPPLGLAPALPRLNLQPPPLPGPPGTWPGSSAEPHLDIVAKAHGQWYWNQEDLGPPHRLHPPNLMETLHEEQFERDHETTSVTSLLSNESQTHHDEHELPPTIMEQLHDEEDRRRRASQA